MEMLTLTSFISRETRRASSRIYLLGEAAVVVVLRMNSMCSSSKRVLITELPPHCNKYNSSKYLTLITI